MASTRRLRPEPAGRPELRLRPGYSPGGSTFPYAYRGGELHCLKYGELGDDLDRLRLVMAAELDFLRQRRWRGPIWLDLAGTAVSARAAEEIVRHLEDLTATTTRTALVGTTWLGRRRLTRALAGATGVGARFSFFDDPERAKVWLVSDGE